MVHPIDITGRNKIKIVKKTIGFVADSLSYVQLC